MNYFTILIAAIGAYAVGALWYGPIFGKQWRALMGISEGQALNGMSMPKAVAGGFVATFVLTYVLAEFIALFRPETFKGTLVFVFFIWLGFIATIMANSVFYESRPWKLYLLNITHYLVALGVAGEILHYWL